MLVISRKSGEVIRIGRDIEISIVEIKQGRVRLGIKAPAALPVQRAENIDNHSGRRQKNLDKED